jgi:Tfp pilus assembly protein PilZ
MTDTKILIVVNDVEASIAYTQALSVIGVACDVAGTFHDMSDMAIENAYNGLIIDILTLVRCSKEEKVIAYDIINLYPVLRVKWENKQKKIKLSPLEQAFSPDVDATLRFFIEGRCSSFPARRLRRHKRKHTNLNLVCSTDGSFSAESSFKSFTVSISLGGIFLHTMQEFEVGKTLWLRFVEFADQEPIAATVRWSLEWGGERSIPGVGLKFERLSEGQQKELRRIMNL